MYSGVIECFRDGQLSGDRRRSKSRTRTGGPGGSIVDQFDLS